MMLSSLSPIAQFCPGATTLDPGATTVDPFAVLMQDAAGRSDADKAGDKTKEAADDAGDSIKKGADKVAGKADVSACVMCNPSKHTFLSHGSDNVVTRC